MGIEKTDGFIVSTTEFDGEPAALVHHRMLCNHPALGPTPWCTPWCRIINITQEKNEHLC